MSTQTENIGLTMPSGSEKYSLDVNNENLEKIDIALGELQELVGSGTGGGLGDKVGNNDDTEAGTVFGDLNIIKTQTEQNGTDIAEAKTFAKGNSDKLTALQTAVNNTKTVSDIINTNTGIIKQNQETVKTNIDNISTNIENVSVKIDNINSNSSSSNTKLDTIANKADVINGQIQTIGNNVNVVKTTVENTNGKVDTAITLLNELKTALANANENIAILLTQSKGVKAIVGGNAKSDSTDKVVINIPDTMNAEKVIVIAIANHSNGIYWTRSGNTVTFYCHASGNFSYQFVEFY